MTFEQLVDRLTSQFDVTQQRAVDVTNERLADMVTRSTALRAVISLGTTTSGTASYTLASNVVKILEIEIPYTAGSKAFEGAATLTDLWAVARSEAELSDGYDGVVAIEPDSDASMTTDSFRLFPVPAESGKAITGLVALRPATLTYSSSTALPIPVDQHNRLLDGCKAELYDDEGRQDEAAKMDASFEQGVQQLERQTNKRGKSRNSRLAISGYDFARR